MPQGFFSTEETKTVDTTHRRSSQCGACGLHKQCRSPKMKVSGKGKKKILVIGEASGKNEDIEGIQFVGKIGRYLDSMFEEHGLDLHRDCWLINALGCRPPDNRKPKPNEIMACRPRVWKVIEEKKPKVILLLGDSALKCFLAHRWKKKLGTITRWRGWTIPDRDVKAWVCPMFHPSFVARSKRQEGRRTYNVAEVIFSEDLARALAMRKKKFPEFTDDRQFVKRSKKPERIKKYLRGLLRRSPNAVTLDFETTGLKPHAKGHRILTCAISEGPEHAFAFPVLKEIKPLLRKVLRSKRIGIIAASMKFEWAWALHKLKCRIRKFVWDPMQAAHVGDNRRGISSMKFQVYIRFGVVDYDSHIEPYKKAKRAEERKYGGNAINRLRELKLSDVLGYNGLDTLYEMRMTPQQMEELGCPNLLTK